MDAALLVKSTTTTSFLPSCERFRRDSVCTALRSTTALSRNMPASKGWSKPVWNLFATIIRRQSSPSNRSSINSPSFDADFPEGGKQEAEPQTTWHLKEGIGRFETTENS